MRHVLSEIRLNHDRTNIIITVGIAISPAAERNKAETRASGASVCLVILLLSHLMLWVACGL